jgi:hypothetical protein
MLSNDSDLHFLSSDLSLLLDLIRVLVACDIKGYDCGDLVKRAQDTVPPCLGGEIENVCEQTLSATNLQRLILSIDIIEIMCFVNRSATA